MSDFDRAAAKAELKEWYAPGNERHFVPDIFARHLRKALAEIDRLTTQAAYRDAEVARLKMSLGYEDVLRKELAELRSQLAAAEKDAKRYRWLRQPERGEGDLRLFQHHCLESLDGELDAAMEET